MVFDPALLHSPNAYRAGEPDFADAASGRAWHRARRTALDSVLTAIAQGPWADHLVLRGSALMATWFGDAAREPGDLDFLVTPPQWAIDDPRTARLFDDIARDTGTRTEGTVRIDASGAVTEDIWTYDRVPGRRMLLPWTADGVPGGTVQIDVVFNELLPTPADVTDLLPLGDGPGCRLHAASRELSLAWKLLWLLTDAHPQGKDLYDAALLAERTPLSYEVVRDALVLGGAEALRPCGTWWIRQIAEEGAEEWAHFAREHPGVRETFQDCLSRLERALQPVLEAAERPGESAYDQWVRWLHPLIQATRAAHPENSAAALGYLEDGDRDGLLAAVVVVREVLGRDRVDLEQALRTVLRCTDRWHFWRGRQESWVDVLGELF